MELVDENEGYYDEEDETGAVVDFLAGEELPTFSLKPQALENTKNDRAKFYKEAEEPCDSSAKNVLSPKVVKKVAEFKPVDSLSQVLNDPYLDRSAATTISQTDDDDCQPIQCDDEDEPDF